MHGTWILPLVALVEMTENLTWGCFLPVMIFGIQYYDDEHRMYQIGIDAKKELLLVSSKNVVTGDDGSWEMGMAGGLLVKTVVCKYYHDY